MSLIIVDVESDGPAPGLYSMVSFGAVIVDEDLNKTFFGQVAPISTKWIEESLAISQIDRKTHEKYNDPSEVMQKFSNWIIENNLGKPVFVSDNPAFDWQFINYYMHAFCGDNPFGKSARRIGDIYSGLVKNLDASSEWKNLRKTNHTHHPVDDAIGNAEALLAFSKQYGLKIPK